MILAVETSSDLCSIAVIDEKGLLVQRAFRHRMHLSERLVNDIQEVLDDAAVTLSSLKALAVGIGPGSFTGVRIGVMTMKTWADMLQIPICGISAHDAVARECQVEEGELLVSVIRARPGSVYARLFQNDCPVTEPEILSLEVLCTEIAMRESPVVNLCGEGLIRYSDEICLALNRDGIATRLCSTRPPSSRIIGEMARVRIKAGMVDDAMTLAPLYLAPPPIDPSVEVRVRLREAKARERG